MNRFVFDCRLVICSTAKSLARVIPKLIIEHYEQVVGLLKWIVMTEIMDSQLLHMDLHLLNHVSSNRLFDLLNQIFLKHRRRNSLLFSLSLSIR